MFLIPIDFHIFQRCWNHQPYIYIYIHNTTHTNNTYIYKWNTTGWWSGSLMLFLHLIVLPTEYFCSKRIKPPISIIWYTMYIHTCFIHLFIITHKWGDDIHTRQTWEFREALRELVSENNWLQRTLRKIWWMLFQVGEGC